MEHRSFSVIGVVSSLILLGGCGVGREIDPGLAAIDEAIGSLENQSADWQQIVDRLGERLPEDAKAIVRQVEEASRSVIATGGVEMRCNVDFFGRRLKENLQRLRNSIERRYEVPPPRPVICQISPDVISLTADRRLDLPAGGTVVRMFGYNLDASGKRLMLRSTTGAGERDLTRCVDTPTTYQMTLNLGANACMDDIRSTGVTWRHVQLEGFAEEAQSPRALPITYAPPRACRSITRRIDPRTVQLSGLSNTRGDKDFWNDISYTVEARLLQGPQRVDVRVEMVAEEEGSNPTRFSGSTVKALSVAVPQGYIITGIETPRRAIVTRTVDTHTETDRVPDTGLVSNWTVNLNKHGDDDNFVGVQARLNTVVVRMAEDPSRVTCTP